MIRRPRYLDPEEVPDGELIVHRGNHIRDVRAALDQLTAGDAPEPFVLHGPPGTGKTMAARYVIDDLNDRDDYRTAYVDCWQDYDDYHLLAQVVDRLGLDVVHHNSTPRSRLADALQRPTTAERVVILDELDMVPEADPLDELVAAPNLVLLCIVNEPSEIEDLVASAWGHTPAPQQRLLFGTYTVRELTAILSARAEHGLQVPMPDRRLEYIATIADGDARLGICTLRAAARHARDAGAVRITEEYIDTGAETARRELHQATLKRLTDHQRALYDILHDRGALGPGALFAAYQDAVDEPRSRATMTKYLSKMEWYGLVHSSGETQDRAYQLDESGYANLGTA